MKFEIAIKEKHLRKLNTLLTDMDCECKTDEEIIRELFWVLGDRGATVLDLRDMVKVKKL